MANHSSYQDFLIDDEWERFDGLLRAAFRHTKVKYVEVLRMRMQLRPYGKRMTLQEVAERLGLRGERVRQIQAKGLKILEKKYHREVRDILFSIVDINRTRL